MGIKRILLVSALAVALLSLFTNQASASISIAFAPYAWGTGSWPGGYIPYTFWGGGGAASFGNSIATLNPSTGINTEYAGPPFGLALTWVRTGEWFYFGPYQPGRVHINTYLDCSLSGSSWVLVGLMTYERIYNGPITNFWWRWVWWNAVSGAFGRCADGGISQRDTSSQGNPFGWTGGLVYQTYGFILAVSAGGTANIPYSRYDEIMWVADTFSPEEMDPNDGPEIVVDPPVAPVCNETLINVYGMRFAPESLIYIYYDEVLMGTTFSDPFGNFTFKFSRHETSKGVHILRAIDQLENSAENLYTVLALQRPVFDLNGDGRVDILDVVLVCRDYGSVVDPPGEAKAFKQRNNPDFFNCNCGSGSISEHAQSAQKETTIINLSNHLHHLFFLLSKP